MASPGLAVFVAFGFFAISIFRLLPERARSHSVTASNICFLLLVLDGWVPVSLLLSFLLIAYAATRLVESRQLTALVCVLAVLILGFAYIKGYRLVSFLPYSNQLPIVIGLSYILARCIQVIVDVREETLRAAPGPVELFNFLCAWPMLLSGPIQRYQQFSSQVATVASDHLDPATIGRSVTRVVRGIFRVVVLGGIAQLLHAYFADMLVGAKSMSISALLGIAEPSLTLPGVLAEIDVHPALTAKILTLFIAGSETTSAVALALAAFFYMVFLYFNFSGYTDIALGLGRLTGFVLPENFRHPWASRSFLDLWSRWHITLASWFKTYVFNPLTRMLIRTFPEKNLTLVFAACSFVTFFLLGLWHGPTLPYVACGLALGLGAAVNMLWHMSLRKRIGAEAQARLSTNAAYIVSSSAMAMAYLALTLLPFWCSSRQLIKIALVFGVWGLLLAFIVLVIIIAPISFIAIRVEQRGVSLASLSLSPVTSGMMLAIAVIYHFVRPTAGSTFVYQGF